MAKAGLIIGYIALALVVIAVLAFIGFSLLLPTECNRWLLGAGS